MGERVKSVIWFAGLLLLAGAAPPLAWAQGTGGSILGEVRDESGASIPGATIRVTNVETGITRTTATDAAGRYRVPNLPVGSYQLEASFPGFKSVTRTGISLAIGQDAVVNLALQVGDVAERVEVT
ncbi:MAG TPA: carboxypeptidase-like regulatory domain-containing protein, partial [Terriglobia bacterium]|nr:carboxypeptidase-like regulatory domain-containing protein [Terriglobia bacterium]